MQDDDRENAMAPTGGMTYADFLHHLIEDGMAAARLSYAHPRNAAKLAGSLQGFSECRNLDADSIRSLLARAAADRLAARERADPAHWHWRSREAEIGWVANVLSAARMSQGLDPITPPTARGLLKAAEILGVAGG